MKRNSNNIFCNNDGNEGNDQMLPFIFDLNPLTSLIYVDNEISLRKFEKSVSKASILGIDTETKPNFIPKKNHVYQPFYPTSLIQIAIRSSIIEEVFIIDMLQFSLNNKLLQLLDSILIIPLQDKSIIKIGQGLLQDMKELTRSYPTMKCFHNIDNILEMHSIVKLLHTDLVNTISLKNLVKEYLNCNLIKKQQLSDWSKRPLTTSQLHYAACDALVLLRLYDVLCYELENKLDVNHEEVEKIISKLGTNFLANNLTIITINEDIISLKCMNNSIYLKDNWHSIHKKEWFKQQIQQQNITKQPTSTITSSNTTSITTTNTSTNTNNNSDNNNTCTITNTTITSISKSKKRKISHTMIDKTERNTEYNAEDLHIPLPIGTGKHLKFNDTINIDIDSITNNSNNSDNTMINNNRLII